MTATTQLRLKAIPAWFVHGPLIATLLLDLVSRELPGDSVASFEFMAKSPLFDSDALRVCASVTGREVALWAQDAIGGVAMQAKATLV